VTDDLGSILFVCTGNVCRSPYLEWGLRGALVSTGSPVVHVASAGVAPLAGHPMSRFFLERLGSRGIDASEFRARALNERQIDQADIVLTATRAHRQFVVRRLTSAATRTFTVLQFARLLRAFPAPPGGVPDLPTLAARAHAARGSAGASTEHDDIRDPWRRSRRVHLKAARQMDEVLEEILEHLIPR